MSFLSRLWNSIRSPVRYVGRDLEGNRFYESKSPTDPERTKRTVQYYNPEDVWKYIGGGKRLAIQWAAWLTHTRRLPPTLQELEADLKRQQRVLENAAMIEARDRAEAEERLRIRQQDTHRALEEASARAQSMLEQPTERPVPTTSEPSMSQTDALKPKSSPASTPENTEAPSKPKVLPPKFLTPAEPRKPKGSSKFTLPVLDTADGVPSQGLSNQKLPASGMQEQAQSRKLTIPPAPMSSNPTSETGSWTPVARRRG